MMAAGTERPSEVLGQTVTQVFKSSSKVLLDAKNNADMAQDSNYVNGARKVLQHMYELWQNNRLCDVILECKEGRLFAHKAALGAYSDLLSRRFSDYPLTELITIDLREFSKESVHVILVFVYTTNLDINAVNVGEVLVCSTDLDMTHIRNACVEFLTENIDTNSVFTFIDIATRHGLTDLLTRLESYLTDRVAEVITTEGFLNISGDRLMRLLTDHKRTSQVSELAVFMAIVRWVEYRREERKNLIPALMRLINFHLISPHDIINHVEKVGFITDVKECFQILYSAMSYHALRVAGSDAFMMSNSRFYQDLAGTHPGVSGNHWTTLLNPASTTQCQGYTIPTTANQGVPTPIMQMAETLNKRSVTMSSGPGPTPCQYNQGATNPTHFTTSGYTSSILQRASTSTTAKQQLTSAPFNSSNATFTTVAHFTPSAGLGNGTLVVVAVGGIELETSDLDVPGRCVHQYNPSTNTWSNLTSLPHNTHHHGVAILHEKLYVIGGAVYNPNQDASLGDAINTVHMFDVKARTWSQMTPMLQRRAYLSVTTDGQYIYAIGGEDQNRNRLDTIERYDPRTNVWTHIASMPSGGKVGAASTVYNGKLYVVGGYNSRRGSLPVMDNVDCLDLFTNQWTSKLHLPQPRCHASIVVAMGRLYLIGGRTKSIGQQVSSLNSILCYDEARDTWNHVANLQIGRHDAGCAAIGSCLYIVGGIRSPSPSCLASVECWDCSTGQWHNGVSNLPYTAAGLACCAVKL